MMLHFEQHTIAVSGYDAIIATRILDAGREVVTYGGPESEAREWLRTHPLYGPIAMQRAFSGWAYLATHGGLRCQRCGHWRERNRMQDGRLGFVQYCDGCVSDLVRACEERNGRLPDEGEFLCPKCVGIWAVSSTSQFPYENGALCTQETNGNRKRWRCRSCRQLNFRNHWKNGMPNGNGAAA